MNEFFRTLIYVGVGVLAAVAAYASRPRLDDAPTVEKVVGGRLFEFDDPTLAKSLEIKQYDEATARPKTFMVAQDASGRWVLPSHGNYPADAESQLKAVAETLADLRILGIASSVATDHALYGVIDPDKAQVGTTGVGTLVTMQDAKGNDLMQMIVGKEVAGATGQRFVRRQTQEEVYVSSIDMTKLPTEFDKWIEKDLLKVSGWDVASVTLKDYVLLPTQQGGMAYLPRMDATLSYASDKSEWKLDKMLTYSRGQAPRETSLGQHEELNKQKLDDLRNGLSDVKIVDVVRKPPGLGNALQVSQDKLTEEQKDALRDYGFYPNPGPSGTLDIFGANGEVIIDTKDGVEYVLRFGDIAPQAEVSSPASTADKDKKGKAKNEEEQVKVHRYLFVMTQLAPSVLTPPETEPEPAGPATEAKPAEGAKSEGNGAQPEATKIEAKADEKKDEQKPAVVDPQQAERERIRKENERKLNEYRDKKTKAETRVKELNGRFADWYYVVSEDVYKKIRLVRSDIVKEAAAAKDEGFGIDAFRKLEEEGLKPAGAKTMP
jgi:hypothetical protein